MGYWVEKYNPTFQEYQDFGVARLKIFFPARFPEEQSTLTQTALQKIC